MKKLLFILVSFISLLSSTLSATVMPVPSTLLASNFENKTAGTLVSDGSLMLATNSTISNPFTFQAGNTYQFNITAYGTPASGVYPLMRVSLDGNILNQGIQIQSGTAKVYTFAYKLKVGGDRNLQLSFINDASTSTENRDLYIKSINVKLVDTTVPTVAITSGPSSTMTTSQSANFVFTYSDDSSGISTVQCSLDSATFSTCSSPKVYSGLAAGSHTFKIKVVDGAGNQTISSIYNWTVLADNGVFPPSAGSDSPYALEILQPQVGLDTKNRFYKAYPGLLYNVRLAVTGGSYPYKFSLKTSPGGMTIDANTGEINWPNPIESSTAYPTTVEVVDNRGAIKQVSWTILATKNKFIFVDPVNGHDGATGTITDPVKGFIDVYGGNVYDSKYSTAKQDYFVYFKSGAVYTLNGFTNGEPGVQWTDRQPLVWMAYPGHRPVIEMSTKALRLVDTKADNFYFEGFEINKINTDADTGFRMGIRIGSWSSNVTIRKNIIHDISATSGQNNQSAIMISADAHGKYWSFQDNEFYGLNNAYGILGYSAHKVLVEDNFFHGNNGGHQIGPKAGTEYWTIRHNKMTNIANGIDGSYGTGIWIYGANETRGTFGYMDISFNYVQMTSGRALAVGESWDENLGPVDVYRNTLVGEVNYTRMASTMGRIENQKNVIVNSLTNGYVCSYCLTPNTLVVESNLIGNANAGIIDSNGKLTSNYLTNLGKMGWQFSNQ